ncbi:RusA family crossover junction endodeoxyribonuclease [Streptomyces sp. HPF1205]|uniref:RusA family crossover junction endodeoxyribonuclease n=1 Tax=Streptomyces sp. HPF1205 TaxID=2873262 RepID=UPI001CECAE2C|nr:RusA family crossover junction endodeoxyribonuclease [Streptomyces sp. HPF1205]
MLPGQRSGPELAPDDDAVLAVTVLGLPAPQGSKSPRVGDRVVESAAAVKPWPEVVVRATRQAITRKRGWSALTGLLEASMVFSFTRPREHFGTGWDAGLLRASAPPRPDVTPDLIKLARSTEDALAVAGAYRDDALLVGYRRLEKRYTTDHGRVPDVLALQGAVIRLYRAASAPPGGDGP